MEFHDFAAPVLGLYTTAPGLPIIGLCNGLLTHERLLRCVLAEELGHHHALDGHHVAMPYASYMGRVILGRAEKRALAWAGQALMPELQSVREVKGGAGVDDLADAFMVTPTFIRAVAELPTYTAALGRARVVGARREA